MTRSFCVLTHNEVVNAWNDTWVGGGVIEELSFLKLCCDDTGAIGETDARQHHRRAPPTSQRRRRPLP